jgi:WSC domain
LKRHRDRGAVVSTLVVVTGSLVATLFGIGAGGCSSQPGETTGSTEDSICSGSGTCTNGDTTVYRGCWSDTPSRALPNRLGTGFSIESCTAAAGRAGYKYAGLQYYGECWAGNTLGDSQLPEASCNTKCNANGAEICGGTWANSVYENVEFRYRGCFADAPTRALPAVIGPNGGFTVESCVSAAAAAGYRYAGLQWHGQCYAGNTIGYQPLAASSCNTACSANSNEACGGAWANSVYEIPSLAPPPPASMKASEVYCGNRRLYLDPGVPYSTQPPNQGVPNYTDSTVVQTATGPSCWSQSSVWARAPAIQNFEVRGWIGGTPGVPLVDPWTNINPYDDEYHVDILVDIGWSPTAYPIGTPPTVPLNSLAALTQYLPPDNLINFATRPGTNTSLIDPAHYVNSLWGGAAAAVVHVEIDSWSLERGGTNYQDRIPPGWLPFGSTQSATNYWPVDLAPGGTVFHSGDYVRLVGTFWRDEDHLAYDWFGNLKDSGDPKNQAKQCLRNQWGTNHWQEMHSPDVFEHSAPGPTRHTVVAYTVCEGGSTANLNQWEDLSAYKPLPGSNIVGITSSVTGWPIAAAPAPTFSGASANFQLSVGPQGGVGLAYHDVVWGCTPSCSGRAGSDDGCGGACPRCTDPAGASLCAGGCCGGDGTCHSGGPAGGCVTTGGACGAACPAGDVCTNGACAGFDCGSCACGCNASATACAPKVACIATCRQRGGFCDPCLGCQF